MERAENGESVIGRVRNRADTWRVGSGFGACACPRPSASVGSVTPGCFAFPVEERSDEVSLPDPAPKS